MFDFCKQTKKIANEWYIHTWSKLMMESEGKFSMVQSWSYLCVIFQSILLDWTWIFFCWQLEIKIYGKHISWGLHVHVFEELIAKLKYHIFHCILYVSRPVPYKKLFELTYHDLWSIGISISCRINEIIVEENSRARTEMTNKKLSPLLSFLEFSPADINVSSCIRI